MARFTRRLSIFLTFLAMALSLPATTRVSADQIGGPEIYNSYWNYGERITVTECVGLKKYKSWGRTKMSGPPEFQIRTGSYWKTVAKSKIISGTDGCAKQSDFPAGVTVDRILKVRFSWTVSELGAGVPDTRYRNCMGSVRQLQVQFKFPNSPYLPRPRAILVCS